VGPRGAKMRQEGGREWEKEKGRGLGAQARRSKGGLFEKRPLLGFREPLDFSAGRALKPVASSGATGALALGPALPSSWWARRFEALPLALAFFGPGARGPAAILL
jgi:hypothetical protein